MNYQECIEYLYSLRLSGMKLGLRNTQRLAAHLDNPHSDLSFIHVAGTNGKGSVCAYLESIYRHAGYRTGLYTSPHLTTFRERVQVDRNLIPESDVIRLTKLLRDTIEATSESHTRPTFFESVTVLAAKYFQESNCDIVLWETGLGGRLDATNIVDPLCSVVTEIAMDHERWLGADIQSIAFEKAGIIKRNKPVVVGCVDPRAKQVVVDAARNRNAPVSFPHEPPDGAWTSESETSSLFGEHQQRNLRTALKTVEILQDQYPCSDSAIRNGLQSTNWPARTQLSTLPGDRPLVIDGAHNPNGVTALVGWLNSWRPGSKFIFWVAYLEDKAVEQMLKLILPHAQEIHVFPIESERAADPEHIAALAHSINPEKIPIVAELDLDIALSRISNELPIVAVGSLRFAGRLLDWLKEQDNPIAPDPLDLNEWRGPPRAL